MKKAMKSVIMLSLMMLTMTGYSQKGVGESKGNSYQGLNPEIVMLKGTVEKIEVGPCKYTTGKAISGTHLMMKSNEETFNIHVGPTVEVSRFVEGIVGNEIEVEAFSTDKLPANHYIAKELTHQGKTTVFRDETLKPVWAGKSGRGRKRKN